MRTIRTLLVVATLAAVTVGVFTHARRIGNDNARPAYASLRASAKTVRVDTRGRAAKDQQLAERTLKNLATRFDHLDGVTVSMGATPGRTQAVAYYTSGQIVISPAHSASIEKILAHEIWHIIDWRDNGRLDWGENLPPRDPSDYFKG